MEEVVCMDVLEALHDLEQDALDASGVQAFVIASFHELVEVAIHILHADVKFLAERVQEDVKCGNEVLVRRQGPEEDDFAELQTRRERFKTLLHRLDGDLEWKGKLGTVRNDDKE